jgi:hypothetical protein
MIWALVYFFVLFCGWWLPAVIFYVLGIVLLLRWRKNSYLAVSWLAVFVGFLGYVLYDGLYLKGRFEQRAQEFKGLVKYDAPPDDVRAIQFHVGGQVDQSCDLVCVKLLFSGRFDAVIIMDPGALPTDIGSPRRLYRSYSLVTQAGCKINHDTGPNLYLWAQVGRCVSEEKSDNSITKRRFEVITDQRDDPNRAPYVADITYIQLVDGDRITPIARAEAATRRFAFPFPVPGIFPRFYHGDLPWPEAGLLSEQLMYGSLNNSRNASLARTPRQILADVFGISLDGPVPVPPNGG